MSFNDPTIKFHNKSRFWQCGRLQNKPATPFLAHITNLTKSQCCWRLKAINKTLLVQTDGYVRRATCLVPPIFYPRTF